MTERPVRTNVTDAIRALARRQPGRVTVRLSGDIDARSVERVAKRLRAALRHAPGALEIDMSAVRHFAPVASFAFFALAKAARVTGTTVIVRRAPAQARTVMRSTGLNTVLRYEESDEDQGGGRTADAAAPNGS